MANNSEKIDAIFLEPLYNAYALASHLLIKYRRVDKVTLPVPVFSIGNISFGGTAKTTMVQYLSQELARNGLSPGIVLRGWKGNIDRTRKPPAIVSDGRKIFIDWHDCGDEARLLAENLLDKKIPVAVGRDRAAASRLLLEKTGANVIILDDGFQFTSLARNLDLVLIDSMCPFGRPGEGLGLLREPVAALSRADIVILSHAEAVPGQRISSIKSEILNRIKKPARIITARTVVKRIRNYLTGEEMFPYALKNRRVAAFSGIGNPLSFRKTLIGMDCDLSLINVYPDHHPYKRFEIERIIRKAIESKSEFLVTTAKDAVRLDGLVTRLGIPMLIIDIMLEIDQKEEFLSFILNRL